MTLWHFSGCLTIQARRFASRSSTRQTTRLNSVKRLNSKPSGSGRSPLNRFAIRPVISARRHIWVSASFLHLCFIAPYCFGRRFFGAVFFLLLQTHFSTPLQFLFHLTKTIENSKNTLKLPFNPFTLFLWSVVGCNWVKKTVRNFSNRKKTFLFEF